jgi:hypothetical protein
VDAHDLEPRHGHGDDAVDHAEGLQQVGRHRLVDHLDVQPGAGRRLVHLPRQLLAEGREHVVGHEHDELPLGVLGPEPGFGGEQALETGADRLDLRGELGPERGEHEAAAGALEQLVAEVPAQPAEGGARRGLGDPDLPRRPGDVPLAQQLPQDHQQVEVEVGQRRRAPHHPPSMEGLSSPCTATIVSAGRSSAR